MKLRNVLKERREELGLSIVDIAKRAGVSRPTIMKYENSEENVITKVIKAYGLKLEPANEPEPLIKDEKIRKAIRAWWETIPDVITDKRILFKKYNDFAVGVYTIYCGAIYPETLEVGKMYTIAELCGEEEE